MIKKGRAPIPGSPNSGWIFIKEFRAAAPTKPMPGAKISEAIAVDVPPVPRIRIAPVQYAGGVRYG